MANERQRMMHEAMSNTPSPICYHCAKKNLFTDGVFFEELATDDTTRLMYKCRFCKKYFTWDYANLVATNLDQKHLHYLMQKQKRGELTRWL